MVNIWFTMVQKSLVGSSQVNDVLILNKNWAAIQVVGWKRAMTLLYAGHAKAIDVDSFEQFDFNEWKDLSAIKDSNTHFIQTISFKIAVPEVIALQIYDKLPRKEVKLTRRNIFERDQFACGYCGKKFQKKDLNIDHIIPRCKGGKTVWENLVCSCIPCNIKKGSKSLQEANMSLKFQPSKPGWKGNISFSMGINKRVSWKKFLDQVYWEAEIEHD